MKLECPILKFRLNRSGIGIVQVLIFTSVAAAISVGIMALVDNNKKSLNNQLLKVSAKLLTDSFYGLVNDDKAWRNTTAANTSMTCILNGTDCSPYASGFTQFVPRNTNNTLFLGGYNPVANLNQGFSPEGDLCNTYSTTTPSNRCPLRYTFWWRPICPASPPCTRKNIRVEVRAVHTAETSTLRLNTAINPQSLYSSNFIRGIPDPAKAAVNCTNIYRVWDPVLFLCQPQAGMNATVNVSCISSSYDAFQRPNGTCVCPLKCSTRQSESYTSVNFPNPYTLTVTCICAVSSIN